MNPTNISKNKKGKGTIKGARKNITTRSTSPANILPKSLKEKEIIFAVSAISSKMPTKKITGPLKEIKREKYLEKPTIATPKIWVAITDMMAKANVILMSLLVERKKGMMAPSSPCSKSPIEPTPGKIPSQLENKIKRKKVAIRGKNFLVFSLSPVTVVIKPSIPSIDASTIFCILPGTGFNRLLTKSPMTISKAMATQAVIMVLETGQPIISNNFSGKKDICTDI